VISGMGKAARRREDFCESPSLGVWGLTRVLTFWPGKVESLTSAAMVGMPSRSCGSLGRAVRDVGLRGSGKSPAAVVEAIAAKAPVPSIYFHLYVDVVEA
jgi:hypothetical protein